MIRKVLVTGFGFIGRHVVNTLLSQGHSVAILERKPDVAGAVALGVEPVVGDVRDAHLMRHLIPHYDGVIHLAGLLGTSELVNDSVSAIETNIVGAINVYEGCRAAVAQGHSVPCVQITVGNYFMDNPYSITKSTSERFAKMYNTEHGTSIRVVRVLNAYGAHQKHWPVRKVIPTFVRAALQGKPLSIYGDGEQVMDMIYVEDVARILVQSLFGPATGLILSAGTGRRLTVNEIASIVLKAAGSLSVVEHLPMRAGEVERSTVLGEPETLLDIGINPASLIPFEDGITRTVAWYREHPGVLGIHE